MKNFLFLCMMSLSACFASSLQATENNETADNPLREYFENNQGRILHKWLHYFDIYERHFHRFRDKEVKILEFGVFKGGSLQMWKHYFGEKAQIIGVDIDPTCKEYEEDRITIYIGDQEDRVFLAKLRDLLGEVDIVIDDGGHTMGQQIATFEEIYPIVSSKGVFLVEDLHTSYWPNYGGGYRRKGTFIEYAKDLLDQLNAWHSVNPDEFKINKFTKTTRSMHVYDSIIVFEKDEIVPPENRMTGH